VQHAEEFSLIATGGFTEDPGGFERTEVLLESTQPGAGVGEREGAPSAEHTEFVFGDVDRHEVMIFWVHWL
jgi:hypothetical protein